MEFNSLPHEKILDWSKLKAFADDKIKVTEKLKFVLGKVENTVGKGENADEKILDWSKLKAFADDKIKVTEKLKFVLGRVENTVGKGENAGYQHFLLFPQCFQKASFSGASKVGIVW